MTDTHTAPIAVLGAGSWGTALALQLARAGQQVQMWCFSEEQTKVMVERRENPDYLPGVGFPDNLQVTSDLEAALHRVRDVLLVTPSHAFADTLAKAKPFLHPQVRLVWGTKGIDPASGKLFHEVVIEQLGREVPMAVLSGPSFAREVAHNLPTAVVIAGNDVAFCEQFAQAIHTPSFRPYVSEDLVGVQLCAAVKNPIAVAAGIGDGLNLGANARCALITRGLSEITRLGVALGGKVETFSGLAGLGDLVLTCTDDLSRNRRFGVMIGRGKSIEQALESVGQVVEGYKNAQLVLNLAAQHEVNMPIVRRVWEVVSGQLTPEDALESLLQRAIGRE